MALGYYYTTIDKINTFRVASTAWGMTRSRCRDGTQPHAASTAPDANSRASNNGVEERPQERVPVDVHEHRRPRLLETGHVARAVVDDALLR
jgi:hypothetical protein